MPTTISIRFEDDFLKDIKAAMKGNRYSTKAEFVREAIRDKLKDLENEKALLRLEEVYGTSKRKTTPEQLKNAREKAVRELRKRRIDGFGMSRGVKGFEENRFEEP